MTVLFLGIDFERKGGPAVLRAFAEVKRQLPGARLVVAGPPAGPPQAGVEWLGHVAERERVQQLFAEATAFAMPSVCEPFGLVLIEAMAHALPVIGSTADAMPEIVEEGVTGFLVPPGDHEALAARMIELLSSPERCSAMGRAARERVQQRFLWSQVVTRVEEGLAQAAAAAG